MTLNVNLEPVSVATPDSPTALLEEPQNTRQQPITKSTSKRKYIVAITCLGLLLTAAFVALRNAGNYLVVDNAVKSDVILVPARGMPLRYERGLDLLRNGYGGHVI